MATNEGNNMDFGSLFGSMFGIPNMGNPTGQQGGDGSGADGAPNVQMPSMGDAKDSFNSFLERMASWSRKALIVLAIVAVIVLAGCYWWFHPALNLQSASVWTWILLLDVVLAIALLVAGVRHKDKAKLFKYLLAIPIAIALVFVIGNIAGFSFIPGNAARYASVLEPTDGTFAEDIDQVNYSEIPVIDRDSAVLLGNRAMGSIPEYVSQFEISSIYSQINYQGKPVRVSPLNYADLFKWFTNRGDGIPAYVIVDMTTQEAKVVRLGEGNGIKYSESEPLARNIDRYVQLRYPTYMFDEKAFEIDESGTPWWVFPVQKRTIGLFQGTTIQRVVLVNACTGETEDYALADVPQWVDRAYPSDLIITQYNWHGLYSDGWLNSWLGQKNVVRTTPGTDGRLGYNYIAQNDDVYLYTGVSSVTADNSIVGFILVNQRTGESRFYSVAGATEDSAMNSAEGAVQHLRYVATFPLLLNIEGQPTYFMALKDAAGLVKMYAMVNITQYQNVAVGDTVAECQADYIKLLRQQGLIDDASAEAAVVATLDQAQAAGTIASITQVVIDGNSHFYVTLEGDGAIYDFALPDMVEIVTYQVGSAIEFTYDIAEEETGTASVLTARAFGTLATTEGDEEPAASGEVVAEDEFRVAVADLGELEDEEFGVETGEDA